MRKNNKIAIFLLVCILFTAIFTIPASAKTYTGTKYGYHSDYIYVHTSKANATVPLTFTKGTLNSYDGNSIFNAISKDIYASYEIKITAWNGTKYVPVNSYDVYCKATNTVKLPKSNTDYRIQVYQWRASTTMTSYMNKLKIVGKLPTGFAENGYYNPYWSKLPKFSTGTLKNCTMYSRNPH